MYDYFVTDHQQNVRMILSEEVQYASNTATMESSRSSQEEPVFGRSGAGNELAASRYATPSGWQNASVGAQVSRLGSLSGNMVGPNTLQKVMAGDQMSATVQYFFQSAPGNSTPLTTMLLNTLGQLLSTGSQVGGLVKGNASAVTSSLENNIGFLNAVNPGQGGTNTPQAYLTIVFFDERFEPIAEADGGVVRQQVAQSVGSGGSTLGLANIKAPRNGYVLVYVSNSSEQPVYFDNLQVGKVNGNILEENHYYSFGLRISAISSRRFTDQYQGETKNGFLYQGAFAELDDDIGWQDFALRSYDAQIGRFMQMDPFSQFASHYTGMGNDPVNMIDPSGGIGIPCPGTSSLSIFFSTVGEGIMNVASSFSSGSSLIKLGVTAAHAGANVYKSVSQFNTVNTLLQVNLTLSVGNLSGFGDEQGDDGWLPLTKQVLRDFVKANSGRNYANSGAWEDYIGDVFENTFHQFAKLNQGLYSGFGYRPNSTPDHLDSDPPSRGVIIDAKSTTMKVSISVKGIRESQQFVNAAYWEIKATDTKINWSTSDYQIGLEVMNLVRNHPDAVSNSAAVYNVVTTAGGNIGKGLFQKCLDNGVLPVHWKPQYKVVNGRMLVRFGFENHLSFAMPSGAVMTRRSKVYFWGLPTFLKF